MQYLVNKTKSVVSSFLSPKVGTVSLMPYEAIPVNVEQWDAMAFNSVRNNPTIMGIFDRIPKEYAEKRRAFLAVDGVVIDTVKQKELENAKNKLADLEASLKEQKSALDEEYKALNEIELSILQAKDNLPTEEKELKKALKGIDKAEKTYVTAKEIFQAKQEDLQKLVNEVEDARQHVKDLEA